MAVANYESVNGSLPLAFIADDDGTPMHSWRVLLLPYMEDRSVFDQYDFSEPWDGPNNRKLASRVASVWSCPSDSNKPAEMTSYVAVTGKNTAWPGATGAKLRDIKDGISKTILLVELKDSDILWMEPRDLTMEDVISSGLSSEHSEAVNVAYVDILSETIRKEELTAEKLKSLLTIDGGEVVPDYRYGR